MDSVSVMDIMQNREVMSEICAHSGPGANYILCCFYFHCFLLMSLF